MVFELRDVVPWGRSYDEYVAMFGLTAADLERNILGCVDGPASFNAAVARRGGRCVSCDPIYRFSIFAVWQGRCGYFRSSSSVPCLRATSRQSKARSTLAHCDGT